MTQSKIITLSISVLFLAACGGGGSSSGGSTSTSTGTASSGSASTSTAQDGAYKGSATLAVPGVGSEIYPLSLSVTGGILRTAFRDVRDCVLIGDPVNPITGGSLTYTSSFTCTFSSLGNCTGTETATVTFTNSIASGSGTTALTCDNGNATGTLRYTATL